MLLLDTHALIWWFNQTPNKLSPQHLALIETAPQLAISVTSVWEVTWLSLHNHISLSIPVETWFDHVEQSGVLFLPVTRKIAEQAVALPEHHKDPTDRLIIASAVVHQAQLISLDQYFPSYRELDGLLV